MLRFYFYFEHYSHFSTKIFLWTFVVQEQEIFLRKLMKRSLKLLWNFAFFTFVKYVFCLCSIHSIHECFSILFEAKELSINIFHSIMRISNQDDLTNSQIKESVRWKSGSRCETCYAISSISRVRGIKQNEFIRWRWFNLCRMSSSSLSSVLIRWSF